jgi:hypothetical protein
VRYNIIDIYEMKCPGCHNDMLHLDSDGLGPPEPTDICYCGECGSLVRINTQGQPELLSPEEQARFRYQNPNAHRIISQGGVVPNSMPVDKKHWEN